MDLLTAFGVATLWYEHVCLHTAAHRVGLLFPSKTWSSSLKVFPNLIQEREEISHVSDMKISCLNNNVYSVCCFRQRSG